MSPFSPNRPAYKSKAGPLQLTVWANEQPDGTVNYVTYLSRSYRLPPEKREGADDDGWRTTVALRRKDLLDAAEMIRLAFLQIGLLEVLNHLQSGEEEK